MSTPLDLLAHGEDCGCCAGITAETPLLIHNRPGLSAIAYRIGTHDTFKRSLLASLSGFDRGAVSALTTRADEDFSIALLDAWSVVADILTFYQERIANECTLRTATERLSVLELAKLLGYEPRPGVAASTRLAFTVEQMIGGPEEIPIEVGIKVQSVPGPEELPQTFETVEAIVAKKAWSAMKPEVSARYFPQAGNTHVYLDGVATNLRPGDALLVLSNTSHWDLVRVKTVTPVLDKVDPHKSYTDVELHRALLNVGTLDVTVHAMRVRAALFGYNAPDWIGMPSTVKSAYVAAYGGSTSDTQWPDFNVFDIGDLDGPTIQLDQFYPQIVEGSWMVLRAPGLRLLYEVDSAAEDARANFTISSKTTAVTIDGSNPNVFNAYTRETVVYAANEPLKLAERPLEDAMPKASIVLAGEVPPMETGRQLIVRGARFDSGETVTEIATVAQTSTTTGGRTQITLLSPLTEDYQRSSVTIYGNTALATHGETVDELLGNGDASIAHQKLTLRQNPLTYVPSDDPSGASAAITFYANDLLWSAVPTLYQAGKRARVFAIERDDSGVSTLEFGDGESNGARLPSGSANLRATYRKGLGAGGNVRAEQLSSLLSRPSGLTAAINPLAASGGQDAESLKDARVNAPLTVLTLDRAVSLLDYQNFARAFAGIAKALATWTWFGEERGVFITVAGVDGAEVSETSTTHGKLLSALLKAGAPTVAIRIGSYRAATFTLSARVKVAADREAEQVLANVEAALRTNFDFEHRSLGQAVTASEVLEVFHSVPGVEGVHLMLLYRLGEDATREERLPADAPSAGVLAVSPAELLTIDPAPFAELAEMTT